MRKKRRQLNVRLSDDASRQMDELQEMTGSTQVILVHLMIDHLWRQKQKERTRYQQQKEKEIG